MYMDGVMAYASLNGHSGENTLHILCNSVYYCTNPVLYKAY